MKMYKGMDVSFHIFLSLGMFEQLHAQVTFPLWKSPQYPVDRGLGGPQSCTGLDGEVKILDASGTWTLALVIHFVASRYTDCAILAPPFTVIMIVKPWRLGWQFM
jgi:hypothetical protein